MSIAVRTKTPPPLNLLEPLRLELRGATGDQALYEPRTMDHSERAAKQASEDAKSPKVFGQGLPIRLRHPHYDRYHGMLLEKGLLGRQAEGTR